jgi:hypothetical protein
MTSSARISLRSRGAAAWRVGTNRIVVVEPAGVVPKVTELEHLRWMISCR